MKINVGIDLGTTYSAVATFNKAKGAVEILKNDLDKNCTPSVICVEDGRVTIGEEAKDMQAAGNLNTAAFYKSMMGEKDYTVYIDGKEYTPEDLSSEFLRVLKKNIEEANNVQIGGAVITVPAYFNEAQRTATMRAGKKAGL
ncbi:MAG: Hsp70 family protein, partial [Clostridia bacterium]|nr:Hsp70 family protein [Clostridia bacterium]